MVKSKPWLIVLSSVLVCVLLYYVEQYSTFDYVGKTLCKLTLFLLVPFLVGYKKYHFLRFSTQSMLKGFTLGLSVIMIVFLSYSLAHDVVDAGTIQSQLEHKNISLQNYLFVGAYIILGNSYLEEVFFRGYIFLNLLGRGKRKTAYIFSSALFSLYHVGIFLTWFHWTILLIIVAGLFAAGLLFCRLNEKHNHISQSWIVHASADLSIVLIGLFMLTNK